MTGWAWQAAEEARVAAEKEEADVDMAVADVVAGADRAAVIGECPWCARPFVGPPNQKYCSIQHRKAASQFTTGRRTKWGPQNTGKLGHAITAIFAGLDVAHPDWRQGACWQSDPDIFFPTRNGHDGPAKTICRGCPIREACLEYAIDAKEKFGIWGGLSERERRRIRRDRRAA